jgi:hypothetical protein
MIYPASYDIVVLQNSSFSMRLTASGEGGTPISISGTTIDADICYLDSHQTIGSFSSSIVSAASGIFDLTLSPVQTADFSVGQYKYDVSLTSAGGQRYYWLKGFMTVSGTCSRN